MSQFDAFREEMRERLAPARITLVNTDVGRSGEEGFWSVTYTMPNGVVDTVHVTLPAGKKHTDDGVCGYAAKRVMDYVAWTMGGKKRLSALSCRRCGGHGDLPCDDSQCGDSTWDHACNDGRTCPDCFGSGANEAGRKALAEIR